MLNFIKKIFICTFLSLAFISSHALAVQLSAGGAGEVLIFPYYTVKADYDGSQYNTLLSLTNSSNEGKALKIYLREGKDSRIVASFNLFIAPGDMWVAALTPEGEGIRITTHDTSCVNPMFQTADFFQ